MAQRTVLLCLALMGALPMLISSSGVRSLPSISMIDAASASSTIAAVSSSSVLKKVDPAPPTPDLGLATFTREVFSHSTPTIEALASAVLSESVGLALDTALLDDSPGDATRPAGLRNGISPLTASTTTPPSEALAEDVRELVVAVAGVAGNAPIILVASPAQAVSLKMWMGGNPIYEVLASSGLAGGVVVAVASNALVSAVDPVPRIDVSRAAVLHMEDVSPLQISAERTPPTVAAPVRSLFQTDTIALRLRLEVSWALRNAGGLAWMQNVIW